MSDRKVLLVGSERFLLGKVREFLEQSGCEVRLANYTEDAVEEANCWQPDFIFLQAVVDSEGLNVRETTDRLHAGAALQNALLVVFTPEDQAMDATRELEAYTKRILYHESADLISHIQEFLARAGEETAGGAAEKQVLVVDDSALQRKMMINTLSQAGFDYGTLEASDGNEAIEILGRNHRQISLILCDWNMPNLSGIEFVEAVARIPALAKIPLVMVTANKARDSSAQAYEKHPKMAGYLEKPFTPAMLQKCVCDYLS